MASISKFNTALLSMPNELTVAAANFNINFSLMKVEAPKEFYGLRDGLSHTRRREAEEGLPHITARCLGALFEAIIPLIPNLTAAYGKRVSEISQHLEGAPQHNSRTGMFADRAGPDGTSIWAAATSGQGAIAMHLLSCMLARIWKPAEATSLWVELVERRKQEIHQAYNATNATGTAAIMAAQQLFTREQLSAWDSSARAWLQTADATKLLQQTQLMLIINNVRMPVNTNKEPYESVIKAWTSAMSAMERLISGVPQRVQDGAILLAISSWHLYPNMHVLSEHIKDIDQGDELMTGSLLTMSAYGASNANEGVFWSLPLSRMQYYSPPIMAERHLASDTSRVSMEEFQIVFLGAVVGQWRSACADELRCCKFIIRLYQLFQRPSRDAPRWFNIFANTASRIVESSGHLRAQYLKLLGLGARRCEAFLNRPEWNLPLFFGLEFYHELVSVLEDPEDRVRLLRRAAEVRDLDPDCVIIRHRRSSNPTRVAYQDHDNNSYGMPDSSYRVIEFSSARPHTRSSRKRLAGQGEVPSKGHRRYAIGRCFESSFSCSGILPCACIGRTGPNCICKEANAKCSEHCHPGIECCSVDPPLPLGCKLGCLGTGSCAGCYNQLVAREIEKEGEEVFLIDPKWYSEFDLTQFAIKVPDINLFNTYGLMLGAESIAGLYSKKTHATYDTYAHEKTDNPTASIDEIEAALNLKSFNSQLLRLGSWWDQEFCFGAEQQMQSFEAFTFASALYASMSGATISIEIIKSPIYETSWATASAPELTEERYVGEPEQDQIVFSVAQVDSPQLTNVSAGNPVSLPMQDGLDQFFGINQDEEYDQPISTIASLSPLIAPSLKKRLSMEDVNDSSTVFKHDIDGDNVRPVSPNASVPEKEETKRKSKVDVESLLARSFACLAWFESGGYNIAPDDLRGVIALANGDSIYAASALLADPSVDPSNITIQRVFGNIGRPEMSLLIPPFNPRLAESDPSSWKLINHSAWDNKFQNCFASTSLHLTFTGFEMPLDVGARGFRDRQVVLLETLVSIDDRGRNIGDLDILSMFKSDKLSVARKCSHPRRENAERLHGIDLVSLDCWDEFLDLPHGIAIFRACGNWQARLGATAAAIQARKGVFILPEAPCLECLDGCAEIENLDIVIA